MHGKLRNEEGENQLYEETSESSSDFNIDMGNVSAE